MRNCFQISVSNSIHAATQWSFFIWTSLCGTFTAVGAVGLELLGVM
jgi:hypothetical protein